MDSPRFKREMMWYMLAFGLALALRLIRLGVFPLNELEAGSALQVLNIVRGMHEGMGAQSAYMLLTSIFFFAFDSSNFFARLAPALTGSLLVFAPMLFRHRLKPRVALILAFLLAFDPGMLSISRQAGSNIFAITFLLFAWGFWEREHKRLAGIFAALALLGGPALWPGLLGLGISWAILQGMIYRTPNESAVAPAPRTGMRDFWLSFIATLLLLGTLFFIVPIGLSGTFNSLTEYLRNWVIPSKVPASHLYLSLLFYQPLALLFALIGLVRGWWVGSRRVTRLSVWGIVALILASVYPARQVYDLAWPLIPLLALAALELSRHMDFRREERAEVVSVGALSFIILVFAWLDLASLNWDAFGSQRGNLRVILFFGALFLLAISLTLVAVGWSIRTARLGGVWGGALALALLTLGAGTGAGHLRASYTPELWDAAPYPPHADLLAATVDQVSQWGTGSDHDLPVLVSNVDSPALLWALHRHKVSVVDVLDASTEPQLLVTPLQNEPKLAASYRGQDFTWYQQPNWQLNFNEWLRWLTLRDSPQTFDTVILWARDDLFIDSSAQTSP